MYYTQALEDYARIEQAILFLEENFRKQPTLSEIAAGIGISEYHFQRLFSRWAGISPKRFLQFLTLEHAKKLLAEFRNLLDVTYETGLSSPGQAARFVCYLRSNDPGEYKQQADGLGIFYGFHASPFGLCLLAITSRGVCGLDFVAKGQREAALEKLQQQWPKAKFIEDPDKTEPFTERIFNPVKNQQVVPVVLKGTNFQLKVWQALLKVPAGTVVSYNDIAELIGQPTAARAVGNAVGRNPVGFVIPCHRVIRKVGGIGDYHWGTTRKRAILAWESGARRGHGGIGLIDNYIASALPLRLIAICQ